MQFWAGDKAQALQAMRLIADLQPKHTQDFDVIFSARFDCTHDRTTVQHVARKFNVFTQTTTSQATGWPNGCNYLWLDSMKTIYHRIRQGTLPRYRWILTTESDDCPLSRTWLDDLDRAFATLDMNVIGSIVQYPKYHVNGNCMFSTSDEMMDLILGIKRIPKVGWDYFLADRFRWLGWADTPAIRSIWGTKTLTDRVINKMVSEGVQMLHGVKDNSVLSWARRNLLRS